MPYHTLPPDASMAPRALNNHLPKTFFLLYFILQMHLDPLFKFVVARSQF